MDGLSSGSFTALSRSRRSVPPPPCPHLTCPGVAIAFRDVSILERTMFGFQRKRLAVQAANGFLEPVGLHAIVDPIEGSHAGLSLAMTLTGAEAPAAGRITANGVPVMATAFRRVVGVIAPGQLGSMLENLTVEEHISFSLHMRAVSVPTYETTLLEQHSMTSATAVEGDPRAATRNCLPGSFCPPLAALGGGAAATMIEDRVLEVMHAMRLPAGVPCRLLTTGERIRLLVAMELVTDPPALFILISEALRDLEAHSLAELASILHHLCRALGKSMVLLLHSLPFVIFERLESLVILGVEGQSVFSGRKSDLCTHFSTLAVPTSVLGALSPSHEVEKRERRRRRLEVGSVISMNSCEPNPSFFRAIMEPSLRAEMPQLGSSPTEVPPVLLARRPHHHRPDTDRSSTTTTTTITGKGSTAASSKQPSTPPPESAAKVKWGDGYGSTTTTTTTIVTQGSPPPRKFRRHQSHHRRQDSSEDDERHSEGDPLLLTSPEARRARPPPPTNSNNRAAAIRHRVPGVHETQQEGDEDPGASVSVTTFLRDRRGEEEGQENDHDDDNDDEEEGPVETLVVEDGDTCIDLVRLWGESVSETAGYAAKFYDSDVRKDMMERMEEDTKRHLTVFATTPGVGSAPWMFDRLRRRPALGQSLTLFAMMLRNSSRQWDFYLSFCFLSAMLGIAAWLVESQGEDQNGMMNIRGLIFLVLMLAQQVNVAHSTTYCMELSAFRHHRASGYYNTLVFVLVLMTRTLLSRVMLMAVTGPFMVYVVGMASSVVWLIASFSVLHASIVLFVCCLPIPPAIALMISNLYVAYCVVFSGFLINLKSLPTFFGQLSALRAAYGAALAEELQGKPYSCDAGNATEWWGNTTSYCYTGDSYLALEGFEGDSMDSAITGMMIGTLCLICAMGLRLHFIDYW